MTDEQFQALTRILANTKASIQDINYRLAMIEPKESYKITRHFLAEIETDIVKLSAVKENTNET